MTDRLDGVDLPPASDRQGDPGHDTALEVANGIRLLQFRAQRMTYAQIAQEMGYAHPASARQALTRALKRHEAEAAEELRVLENIGLDADERALRRIIAAPDSPARAVIAAVDARTRLSARRARLNGLDAPVQVQLSAGIQAELADALEELAEVLELHPGADGVYAVDPDHPQEA